MHERLGAWTYSFLACSLLVAPAFGDSPSRPGAGSAEWKSAKAAPGMQVQEVRFDSEQIEVKPAEGAGSEVVVRYPGALTAAAGAPDLPRVLMWIEIPAGMRVRDVRGEPWGEKDLGAVRVRPAAADVRVGDPPPAVVADRAIYDGGGAYPERWAGLGTEGSLRGHQVAGVWVSPVRWEVKTGRLTRAEGVRVSLLLEPGRRGPEPVERRRVVRDIEARFEAGAAKVVRGFQPVEAKGAQAGSEVGSGPAGPGPYQPSFRPSPDGSPVEYVIVTSQALAATFQPLADWKTKKGVQAVVRTVEWIDQTYPNGVDRAERIRFFIRDAYQNWGTLFVLLGGDTDVIPPRYAQMVIQNEETIPADYYYGCLDGNWNADGDQRFGESMTSPPGDNADLLFEVNVGRAPVSTVSEAQTFVNKTLLYDSNPPASTRYPASIVVLAERLFTNPPLHGADIAEQALAYVPPWFRIARLYEESANYPGSVELTLESAVDSVNAGFGIVHHVGHGYRNTMSLGEGTMSNADADNLTNAPLNSVVFAINCSSAAIDFNSIGERWVKNPNGGSIGYIGTSRLSFIGVSTAYQNAWYQAVFDSTSRSLAAATDIARLVLVPNSTFDGASRWNLLATTTLGDPEVDLYTNAAIPIQVTHPASVPLSPSPVTVTVMAQGAPVAGASVTLWKQNEVYARATTNGSGQAQLVVGAQTTGPVTVTVHKTYYRVYSGSMNVTSTANPYLFALSTSIDDDSSGGSIGDGDGQADAGETIDFQVTLRNAGGSQATGVTGTLAESDPANCIAITVGSVSYGTIPPGGSSGGTSRYRITIAPGAEVACQPVLTVNITSGQGSWSDVLTLPIRRPYLEHYAHVVDDAAPRGNGNGVVEAGEEIWYLVTLRNTGQDRAVNVSGTIEALRASDHQPHPQVTVTDANSSFGTIAPGGSAQGDRFAFILAGNADPSTLLLRLTLNDALGPEDVQYLDVLAPAAADSVATFGAPNNIRIAWKRSSATDARGYDIYRSLNPGGPFTRLNNYTIDGSSAYEDLTPQSFVRYYYQVVVRDSSYNASEPSMVASGTTNPPLAAGWPIELSQQTSSSLVLFDAAGGADYEVFTAADYEYAWHADGTEVRDGDSDGRTSGPFAPNGFDDLKGFAATTAVADIDNDQDVEIVNVGWSAESVYVWDDQGQIANGWPKWVMGDFNWPSPVLADLDGDHSLEVIVWAGRGGRLFAWHADGTEVADGDNDPSTDGVLFRVSGTSFNYSSPAIGEIDGDPQLEIIFCVNISSDSSGKVYAINHDGTLVPGWPFATGIPGEPSQVTSSPAVGDLDRNGTHEIVVVAGRGGGSMYVLNGNGTVRAGWPRFAAASSGTARTASPSLGDLNGDGFLDIVYPGSDGRLYAFNRDGGTMPGFPVTFATGVVEASQSTASIADIDGDGQLEILFGDETGKLHAYNRDGSLASGFPIQLNGEVRSTPIIWDIDQDNLVEVAVVGFESTVYVWDLPSAFNGLLAPWPFFRHDVRNTGFMNTAPVVIGVDDPGSESPVIASASVEPARPNPFNPSTAIAFAVPGLGARPVSIAVYDPAGRLQRLLLDGPVGPGRHTITWDGRSTNGMVLGSGVYFIRVAIGEQVFNEKVVLLK